MNNVEAVDEFEVSKRVGESQAYYGDVFYKCGDYYLVGFFEEEEDNSYYLYELYSNKKLVNTTGYNFKEPEADLLKFVNDIELAIENGILRTTADSVEQAVEANKLAGELPEEVINALNYDISKCS